MFQSSDAHFLHLYTSLYIYAFRILLAAASNSQTFYSYIWSMGKTTNQINSLNQLRCLQHFSCSFYSKFKHSWFIIFSTLLSFVRQTFSCCCWCCFHSSSCVLYLRSHFFINFGSWLLLVFRPWTHWMPKNVFGRLFIWCDAETIVSTTNYIHSSD